MTQLDVAREALAQIGTRTTISALDDGSPEATYINLLYGPIRDFLLVDGDWDFSMGNRRLEPLSIVEVPWTYAYAYPDDVLRVRQLVPFSYDPFNPLPVEWNISIGPFGGTGLRRIYTHVSIDRIIYTKAIGEGNWDAIFRQSFVRMLASALAFALENRIEASKQKLEEALGFAGVGKVRDF